MSKRTIRIPYVGVGGATTTQRETYACGTMQPCEVFFPDLSEKFQRRFNSGLIWRKCRFHALNHRGCLIPKFIDRRKCLRFYPISSLVLFTKFSRLQRTLPFIWWAVTYKNVNISSPYPKDVRIWSAELQSQKSTTASRPRLSLDWLQFYCSYAIPRCFQFHILSYFYLNAVCQCSFVRKRMCCAIKVMPSSHALVRPGGPHPCALGKVHESSQPGEQCSYAKRRTIPVGRRRRHCFDDVTLIGRRMTL